MKKIILNLLGDAAMKKVKLWLKENGFGGILAIGIAGSLAFLGMWFWASCVFAWFLGKNWEIISNIYKNKYKDKVDDLVDDVKDKF